MALCLFPKWMVATFITALLTMSISTNFVNALADDLVWRIPGNGHTLPHGLKTRVGNSIVFEWMGTHNVYIHPTHTCNNTGSRLVGFNSPATYVFQESDVGQITFACEVSGHCEAGQKFTVTVQPSLSDPGPGSQGTPDPTSAAAATWRAMTMAGTVFLAGVVLLL